MDEFASVFQAWSLPILVLDRELNIAYCNAAYEGATQRELNHRMKNVHTVVQAMARLSSRSAESLEDFRDSFLGRMDSMSRAHERLMRSGMISVDLKHLLEDEIKGVAPDMESTVNLP